MYIPATGNLFVYWDSLHTEIEAFSLIFIEQRAKYPDWMLKKPHF